MPKHFRFFGHGISFFLYMPKSQAFLAKCIHILTLPFRFWTFLRIKFLYVQNIEEIVHSMQGRLFLREENL